MTRRIVRWLVAPPPLLAALLLVVGIYGTGVVYHALTLRAWGDALFGLSLVLACVFALGTPLAIAMQARKDARAGKKRSK